jgi:hypothetical protein
MPRFHETWQVEAVEKVVKVDSTADIFDDPSVRMETVPGVAEKEAALFHPRQCAPSA